jgi:hypothetical protein
LFWIVDVINMISTSPSPQTVMPLIETERHIELKHNFYDVDHVASSVNTNMIIFNPQNNITLNTNNM